MDKEPTTQILAVAEKIADNAKTYTELKALRRWAQAMRSYWLHVEEIRCAELIVAGRNCRCQGIGIGGS
jgi:hypothetical protein